MNVGIGICGRAVPFLGIYVSNFRYSINAVRTIERLKSSLFLISWIGGQPLMDPNQPPSILQAGAQLHRYQNLRLVLLSCTVFSLCLSVLCKVHVGGGESYSQLLSQLEGGNVVELGPLGTDLAWSLLQHQLAAINRTLTNYQNRCSVLFF